MAPSTGFTRDNHAFYMTISFLRERSAIWMLPRCEKGERADFSLITYEYLHLCSRGSAWDGFEGDSQGWKLPCALTRILCGFYVSCSCYFYVKVGASSQAYAEQIALADTWWADGKFANDSLKWIHGKKIMGRKSKNIYIFSRGLGRIIRWIKVGVSLEWDCENYFLPEKVIQIPVTIRFTSKLSL